jgi:hypothetical protein
MKTLVKFFRKLSRHFELKWGWFFTNGRKQESWHRYIRKKYGNNEEN